MAVKGRGAEAGQMQSAEAGAEAGWDARVGSTSDRCINGCANDKRSAEGQARSIPFWVSGRSVVRHSAVVRLLLVGLS